ncbi:hypothetical protein AK830_g918 [Neonectria ditissima]|uniref:GST N-terminal domain-containing protein n=1 Tax=Neonectria ditissima TaxID=78410 RepID=A0A0P7BV89_9HYPO|nr:hypothetical protein AK830_g918 [Neonectria ditissima]
MYNASFLLTKAPFLESVSAGTARPHMVLSVCAWGANFYRDADGQASLKNNGCMVEWAKRAGQLVFQEAEELLEENVVTFCNLALFWHSQGSWRISDLHKVVSLVKSRESGFSTRLTSIYALEESVSNWWETVHSDFKLTPSDISALPLDALPKIFLVNLVFHQSLCVLHASIVPLFSWGSGGHSSTARQLSAQVAFEHACTVSELMKTVLSTYPRLSAMPSFVAYVAYSGCAIQMPFMWCLNSEVKERAHANVRANVKMIHTMASYWKFAELLKIHVRCLFSAYQNNPTTLDDEPKFINPTELTSFRINATFARASILEFTGVLRPKGHGYVKPGEETWDLGIQNDGTGGGRESDTPDLDAGQSSGITLSHRQTGEALESSRDEHEPWPQQPLVPYPPAPLPLSQPNISAVEPPTLDVFNSFIDPDMLNLFSQSEMPDFSQFGNDLFNTPQVATPTANGDPTTTMVLVVHHLQCSQSERIPWLCEELGIDYELKLYQRAPLLAPPEYKALHRMGAAPVIQDGNLTLAESGAVIEYICHKYGNGALFLDPADPAYADFLYWWHWANGSFQPAALRIKSSQDNKSSNDVMTKFVKDRFNNAMDGLEQRLSDNEWLAGTQFTAADVMVVFTLTTMRYFVPYSLEQYGNVLKYLERIGAREAYQKAMSKSDPTMELALGSEPPKNPKM